MFDQDLHSSKEFIEFQRGVFKAITILDSVKNVLIKKGIISQEELIEEYDASMATDYVKNRMVEYDKAIKEIEEYEKMDFGDLFSSLFKPQSQKKGDDD